QYSLAAESHPREGISRERGRVRSAHRARDRDSDCVDAVAGPWRTAPDIDEVLWVKLRREDVGRILRGLEQVLERARDHEVEGIRDRQADEDEHAMLRDRPGAYARVEARHPGRDTRDRSASHTSRAFPARGTGRA